MKAGFCLLPHPLGGADILGPVTKISNAASFPSPALQSRSQIHTCPNAFRQHQSFGRLFRLILHDGADTLSTLSLGVLSDIRAATSRTNSSQGKMSQASLFHSLCASLAVPRLPCWFVLVLKDLKEDNDVLIHGFSCVSL